MHNALLKRHTPAAKPDMADDTPKLRPEHAEKAQVAVPNAVTLHLPKEPAAEIAMPASINGRDLSRGGP